MNPNESGWLRRYIAFRRKQLISAPMPLSGYLDVDSGQFLYQLLQPTGLIYGYPISLDRITHPRENEWDENARLKVLMVECFIQCGLYLYHPPQASSDEVDRLFAKVVADVKSFYQHSFSRNAANSYGAIFPKRSDLAHMESLLDQRIFPASKPGELLDGFFSQQPGFSRPYFFCSVG